MEGKWENKKTLAKKIQWILVKAILKIWFSKNLLLLSFQKKNLDNIFTLFLLMNS